MANIKSSKKAIKVIAKKTDNNHELKARVKNYIRLCDKLLRLEKKIMLKNSLQILKNI